MNTTTSRSQDEVRAEFTRKDFAEVALGGSIMAFPTATTEEVWNLGTELSLARTLLFALASLVVLSVVVYGLHVKDTGPGHRRVFFHRLAATYLATMFISAALLFAIDRIDLWHEPLIALRRTILVAFPASFAATVVDGMGGNR